MPEEQEKKVCPEHSVTCSTTPQPVPDVYQDKQGEEYPDYTVPKLPDEYAPGGYRGKIPIAQKEQINAERMNAQNVASEKRSKSKNEAKTAFSMAKAEYDAAENKYKDDKKDIETASKNKKKILRQKYRDKLRESLPKNCLADDQNNIEQADKIPAEDKAICIADFIKALADEDFDYLNKLKTVKEQWQDAQCKYDKAKLTYENSICAANFIKQQARAAADVEWTKKIAVEVKKACK
jgi:hypothetical protein